MRTESASREKWGSLTGVVFVVLLVVSFFMVSTPSSNASGQKVIAFYANHSNKRAANISALLIDVSVVAGLFFFGYLRDHLRQTDLGRRLAPVAFGGGVLFAAAGLVVSGSIFALTDVPKDLTPASAQALNLVNNDLPFPLLCIGISVLALASGIVFLKSNMVPTWFGWFSIVIGVVALVGPIGFFAFPAIGVWILILSYLFYSRPERASTEQPVQPHREMVR